jgi:hypothetical protein
MTVSNRVRSFPMAAMLALHLLATTPALAELRVNELDIYLNDHDVTVHVVLLGTIPPGFNEGLQSGIPAHVRYTVELWQYNRLWRDALIKSVTIERQLAYNVVTKEYKVISLKGETRPPHGTRDLRDAQRVLSEVQGLKLGPASGLDAAEIFYVRVHAESALNGENTFLARMSGTAEQAMRQSDFRTIQRVQ